MSLTKVNKEFINSLFTNSKKNLDLVQYWLTIHLKKFLIVFQLDLVLKEEYEDEDSKIEALIAAVLEIKIKVNETIKI